VAVSKRQNEVFREVETPDSPLRRERALLHMIAQKKECQADTAIHGKRAAFFLCPVIRPECV